MLSVVPYCPGISKIYDYPARQLELILGKTRSASLQWSRYRYCRSIMQPNQSTSLLYECDTILDGSNNMAYLFQSADNAHQMFSSHIYNEIVNLDKSGLSILFPSLGQSTTRSSVCFYLVSGPTPPFHIFHHLRVSN